MSTKRSAAVAAEVKSVVQIPGTNVTLRVRDQGHELVPEVDPNYFFRPALVEEIAWAIKERQNVMLVGDTSTGKTSLIEQLAAHTRSPMRRVNLHGESDTTLFVGRDKPVEVEGRRTIVYEPGILAVAMAEGHWLLLDEIDAALQPVLFVLQQVLEDDGKLLLEDGKGTIVRKHPDFRLFATANSVGIAGRNRLMYSGTMGRMNEATLDRFGCVLHVDYLSTDEEIKVISSKVPNLDVDFIKGIVRIASEVRTSLKDDRLSSTLSTRRCLQWARAMDGGFHPMRAAQMTILNKLNQDDHKVIYGVIQRFFEA